MSRIQAKHLKIYTGYADVGALDSVLLELARVWKERQVESVRIFRAGMVDVYLTIHARRWYCAITDSNDPDWHGDAEDVIADSVFKYHYRVLQHAPQPQRIWRGNWRSFANPDDLAQYARDRINRLSEPVDLAH